NKVVLPANSQRNWSLPESCFQGLWDDCFMGAGMVPIARHGAVDGSQAGGAMGGGVSAAPALGRLLIATPRRRAGDHCSRRARKSKHCKPKPPTITNGGFSPVVTRYRTGSRSRTGGCGAAS